MRVRSSQKAVMRNTKDDIEDEENNRQNRSICNPPHKAHVDAICPIVKGMFGKPKTWNEELNLERLGQIKRFEASIRRAWLVQKKVQGRKLNARKEVLWQHSPELHWN